ncbi:unnamed protein product [Linum tenue]|uniref:Uncharacterized protein n=2 Tax=Linum tenue TaxID=586396 RepID=A0AAV0PV99_9ROSI|nr:unnamed protein product [Linum tenue]
MKSGNALVIGLSLVFGCLFLALAAELYYLLWWKRRISSRESEGEDAEDFSRGSNSGGNYAKELIHLVCWKKPSSSDAAAKPDPKPHSQSEPDLELGSDEGKDSLLKGGAAGEGGGEESVELELMRLHNLAGPPRFLFTINEESKEDLESEDGKSRLGSRQGSRTKSLSDILLAVDTATPLFTPLESPRYSNPLESYHRQGFNPLFESSAEAELNRLRSSPPPKFKFLRDAEEKLLRRLLEEAQRRGVGSDGESKGSVLGLEEGKPLYPAMAAEVMGGSFLGFLYAKNREVRVHRLPPLSSTSSQVIPLASSPTSTISDL